MKDDKYLFQPLLSDPKAIIMLLKFRPCAALGLASQGSGVACAQAEKQTREDGVRAQARESISNGDLIFWLTSGRLPLPHQFMS